MNKQQIHLLNLLKEIDDICRKYSIRYYVAGGTVIGAARHGGFIPWDDDVDIYMAKDEFQRFRSAFKKESLPDRKLEYKDDNNQFYATIPRYNEETTTQICRYHVLGNASGGLLIDILIMDEFPNDYDKRSEYLAKLNVYADLIAVPYTHSQRNDDKFMDYYEKYTTRVKSEGRKKIIAELENDLFQNNPEECNDYILRWAALPIVLPKDMMGTPVYMKFEDMEVPVPEKWYDYLVLLYGTDWVNIPHIEGQDTHIAISDMDNSYKVFMRERDRFISQKDAYRLYWRRKNASVKLQYARRPIEEYLLSFKVAVFQIYYRNKVSVEDILILYQTKEYEKIVELSKEYIEYQTQPLFIGELKHYAWHRWQNPIIIPISTEELEAILLSLLMTGEDKQADKIIRAYDRARMSDCIPVHIRNLLNNIMNIEKLYYNKNYEDCLYAIEQDGQLRESRKGNNYFWLTKVKSQNENVHHVKTQLEKELENDNCSIEILKAYGDLLFANGNISGAVNAYEKVLSKSRNGIFWLDIEKKTGLKGTLDVKREYSMTAIEQTELQLLEEIDIICKKNNIDYIFSGIVAKNILSNGFFGFQNYIKTIYMDAPNAKKFIDATKEEGLMQDRDLLSWEKDCKINDFKLVYTDKKSVYARLDKLNEWRDIGIHIDIRILRDSKSNKIVSTFFLILELMLSVSNIQPVDKGVIRNTVRRFLYTLDNAILNIIGKQRFSTFLFRQILNYEVKRDVPEYYFFRKNLIKGIYKDIKVKSEYIAKKFMVDAFNRKWPISLAEKEKVVTDIENIERPKESLFYFAKTDMTWETALSILDLDRYNSFDWKGYGSRRKRLGRINTRVREMWLIMCRGKDKLDIWQMYSSKIDEMRNMKNENEYQELQAIIKVYDEKVRYYWDRGLTFFVLRDLTEIYCDYLANSGDIYFANQIIQKSRRVRYKLADELSESHEIKDKENNHE